MENGGVTIDLSRLPSPAFVVDELALKRNLALLDRVQKESGAKVLLALKGFAMFSTFALLNRTLAGTCASSYNEARLGREEFGGEVHTFAPAYSEKTLKEILPLSNHLIFNSPGQWQRFRPLCRKFADRVKFGLRINPEHSETKVALYDPCRPGSRLGTRVQDLRDADLDGITGLHFHTLCEQDSFALERTLQAVEEKFSDYLKKMAWVNFGGGHHITREDYDIDHLCRLISAFREKYQVNVYLEPGEAVALNAGIFVATVLDLIDNHGPIAILDASAATHLPDILEMPYRPGIIGAGQPGEKNHTYSLGGVSCLAGDNFGSFSFAQPLKIGDRLVFTDMAHYTMVKTNTFNGVPLPAIALHDGTENIIIREFGYLDFKTRLS
ncbi:MAG: carboxynorspermidine decarboxylase [Deltaproteobacteria bacterium]|nr:carboxynorspermidine decarboxylase [Deltaproteobacteria bacterium]